jgi:hypothetical protein
MAHDSVGSNVSLLHEKMKTGGRTELLHPRGLNEQPSHAQILDAGQIAISISDSVPPSPSTFAALRAGRTTPSVDHRSMYYVAVRTITVE